MSKYSTKRVLLPVSRKPTCIILDPEGDLHDASTDYLFDLTLAGKSINTVRTYAAHIVQYLNYCKELEVNWDDPDEKLLVSFLHSLHNQATRHPYNNSLTTRSSATANGIYRTTLAYLEYCSSDGIIPKRVIDSMHRTTYRQSHSDQGSPSWEIVKRRAHKLAENHPDTEYLSTDKVRELLGLDLNDRDRLLVDLLATTGIRIGEALGLRHGDLHFLPENTSLGCETAGPHIHIERRNNPNGALAKSRYGRRLPVTDRIVHKYAICTQIINKLEIESDYVFVNMHRGKLGEPVTYATIHDLFKRISSQVGTRIRPHSLRHYCASLWVREGVPHEVVQALLGHRNPASMSRYVHPEFHQMIEAVRKANTDA
ncbi:tyrosine-type recombinase/integrase [Dietzia alimentaria]|uniref:tyrosine-type recombinase/integrase n=1 Tax=Dietzia alimentaria TaxID=665550 RepID=UPI0009DA5DB4|nr:tyrosine-type recombinase/integrase [Dietzia alimentaria]